MTRPAATARHIRDISTAQRLFGRARKAGAKRFFTMPRTFVITREGKWFLGILFFIGVSAINTGNNLLYLVVATLLSLIIISGILSENTLRRVKVERILPRYIYKNEKAAVRLRVTNDKRLTPSFSIRVKESETDSLDSPVTYVLKLNHGNSILKSSDYTFRKRGRHSLGPVHISTRFPFGIFIKGRREFLADEVLVYPSLKKLKNLPAIVSETPRGSVSMGRKGEGIQIHGVREYTYGDDARHIHWKSVARTKRLMYKEREAEAEHAVRIVFENHAGQSDDEFEDMVDAAAGLAAWYCRNGYTVGLKTLSHEVPPGSGPENLHRILRALALIEPAKSTGKLALRTEPL